MAGDCIVHDEYFECAYLNEACLFRCELCHKDLKFIEAYRNKNQQLVHGECLRKEEEDSHS